jgi:hypothetical protein
MSTYFYAIQLTSETGGTAQTFAVPLIGVFLLMLFAVVDRSVVARLKTTNDVRV